MVSATLSALDAAKSEAKVLLSKRDDLEHELEAEMSQLKATGAGEHGSLVDKEVRVLHAAELSTVQHDAAIHGIWSPFCGMPLYLRLLKMQLCRCAGLSASRCLRGRQPACLKMQNVKHHVSELYFVRRVLHAK